MSLGKRIKTRRKEFKLTQAELASLVGVSFSTINSLENRDSKKSEHDVRIAQALGVTVEWLRTGEGQKYPAGTGTQDAGGLANLPTSDTPTRRRICGKMTALSDTALVRLEPLIDELLRLDSLDKIGN